ncbi:MAG: hypothetical protein SGILL_007013 [Bacillariaceae sp.]
MPDDFATKGHLPSGDPQQHVKTIRGKNQRPIDDIGAIDRLGNQEEESIESIGNRDELRTDADTQRHLLPTDEEGRSTYIVVYKDQSDDGVAAASMMSESFMELTQGEVVNEYRLVLKGMAAKMTEEAAKMLEDRPEIASVRKDMVMHKTATWGLDRVDQPALPLDNTYIWEGNKDAGAGINVCVSCKKSTGCV